MSTTSKKQLMAGLGLGAALTAAAAVLMGQGANTPVKSEPQYFVTPDGEGAHLWVREGITLRVVAHAECKECEAKGHAHEGHDHDHDGHDHKDEKPKK